MLWLSSWILGMSCVRDGRADVVIDECRPFLLLMPDLRTFFFFFLLSLGLLLEALEQSYVRINLLPRSWLSVRGRESIVQGE